MRLTRYCQLKGRRVRFGHCLQHALTCLSDSVYPSTSFVPAYLAQAPTKCELCEMKRTVSPRLISLFMLRLSSFLLLHDARIPNHKPKDTIDALGLSAASTSLNPRKHPRTLNSPVSGPRRIDLTLEGVDHLPKMDGMFGKCDPYAVLAFEGAEYRTEVVKNAYEAR